MEFNIQEQTIQIQTLEEVFTPSLHGTKGLGEATKVTSGEKVIDIGTGTGILAILAAKLGGKVYATDVLEKAVHLCEHNAALNNVIIRAEKGDIFGPYKEKFDVIIANIPQELLSPKIIANLHPDKVTGMYGQGNGEELLLRTLTKAPEHMHENTRMYVVVYGMTDFRSSLKTITKTYHAQLVGFHSGPVKEFIYDDLEWYEKEKVKRSLLLYKVGDTYWSDLFVFELKLK